ncbi:hypothetical protein [Geopseudomonas aromaticivorans]
MAKSTKKTEADFLELLRVSPSGNPQKRTGWLQARIIGLGFGTICTRCCGSGSYSFNLVDGSRCYGCSGSGYGEAKLTDELYARIAEAVAAGKLDIYLAALQEEQALSRQLKVAVDTVMDAWLETKVSDHYDWSKAAKGEQPHRRIADEVNKPMCAAYEATRKAVAAAESVSLRLSKAKTQAEREQLKDELAEAMRLALKTRDEALAIIAGAKAGLAQILAEQAA